MSPDPVESGMGGVSQPQRYNHGVGSPAASDEPIVLIDIAGPGLFLAARVVKTGGSGGGETSVSLLIDGNDVWMASYFWDLVNGQTAQNPYGVVLAEQADIHTMTLGFPYPLRFAERFVLLVYNHDEDVQQIVADVIHAV